MCALSGGSGRHQDPAEEVDYLPEGAAGVLPPRAPRLLQQPEGRVHAAGPGLEGNHLLRHLPRPVVSGTLDGDSAPACHKPVNVTLHLLTSLKCQILSVLLESWVAQSL